MDLRHFPFMLALMPFLMCGICLPSTLYGWHRGRMIRGDGVTWVVIFVICIAWYMAILRSIKAKKQAKAPTLLGRKLQTWYWAPPVMFAVGILCGVVALLD